MGTSYYNVWTNDPFIYKSTISGVNVYDLGGDLLSILGFIDYENTSGVWADDNYVYIATSVSGIYRCDVSTVTGTVTLTPYKQYPEITSNYVYYIHGGGDYLCATTASGVDHYDLTTGSGISTTISGISKCFQTERGEFYYSYNPSDADKELHVVYDNTNNWTREALGYVYVVENNINDIHVTETTSRYNNGNVLFLATSSGVVVIEEKPGDEENNNYKYYYINT